MSNFSDWASEHNPARISVQVRLLGHGLSCSPRIDPGSTTMAIDVKQKSCFVESILGTMHNLSNGTSLYFVNAQERKILGVFYNFDCSHN